MRARAAVSPTSPMRSSLMASARGSARTARCTAGSPSASRRTPRRRSAAGRRSPSRASGRSPPGSRACGRRSSTPRGPSDPVPRVHADPVDRRDGEARIRRRARRGDAAAQLHALGVAPRGGALRVGLPLRQRAERRRQPHDEGGATGRRRRGRGRHRDRRRAPGERRARAPAAARTAIARRVIAPVRSGR